MSIRIREQAGTDAGRKFDYQMAVALDYLLSEIDNDVIVVIETLEDFAVFRDFNSENESIDIYQVKTKNSGLYDKNTLFSDNVVGKIILTDFFFDSKARTLNIVVNTPLKGSDTEDLEKFSFEDKLTPKNLQKLKDSVLQYLNSDPNFNGNAEDYWGKLIYVKSSLPFSAKDDRYSESLIGKTNNTIAHYLNDVNHTINPQIVFDALKLTIEKRRLHRFVSPVVSEEEAISKKGISTEVVRKFIEDAQGQLTKEKILDHARRIFSASDFKSIKDSYSTYVSYAANLTDQAFLDAKEIVKNEYDVVVLIPRLNTDEVIRQVSDRCVSKIHYYTLPIIQIITIVVVFG